MSKEQDIWRSQEPNDILRRARMAQGLTQGQLAELVGVEEQTIRRWEQGKRAVSIKYIARLSEVLSETPEALGLLPSQAAPPSMIDEGRHDEDRPEQKKKVNEGKSEQLFPLDENRRRMLNRVRSRWITGLLDRVETSPLITLRLRMQPWNVARLWSDAIGELPPSSSLSLPDGTTIVQVYDSVGSELLMLGEPGSGKTTQLLFLTRELLKRAVVDEQQPIPVIFNLSSWAQKKVPLAHWLIDELNVKYQVPLKLAQRWVEQDAILPLLDGLDEVSERARDECVLSINEYRQQHGLLPMVVCCRSEDYMQLSVKLVLGDAVALETLSFEQIDAYFLAQGDILAALRAELQRDSLLTEMVSNPLMLSVVAQVYRDLSLDDVLAVETVEERRHIVFEHYVQRVLSRKSSGRYTAEQMKTSLSWLARLMNEQKQAEFYVESLQPNWLPGYGSVHFRNTITWVFFSIQAGLVALFVSCLRGPGVVTPGFPFFVADSKTLLGWMSSGLGGIFQGTASLCLMWDTLTMLVIFSVFPRRIFRLGPKIVKDLWFALGVGILVFILSGGIAWLVFSLHNHEQFQGQIFSLALFCGVGFFYLSASTLMLKVASTSTTDSVWAALLNSFISAFISSVIFVLSYTAQGELLTSALAYGCVIGVWTWALNFFLIRIRFGLEMVHPDGIVITPAEVFHWNWATVRQGLRESVHSSVVLIVFCAGSGLVLNGGMSTLFHGWRYGIRYGLIYGVIIGLIVGLAHMLTIMIRYGWSSNVILERQLLRPNVGITLSAHNALLSALIFGPLGGIIGGLVCGLSFGVIGGLSSWVILGIAFSVVFSLFFFCEFFLAFGGMAVIEHYILRWYLWRSGILPLNVVRFLDDVAARILLRKIGGGYIFMHRLLLEHFATLPYDKSLESNQKGKVR